MTCLCEQPGFCPVFERDMSPRQHQICRGEVLTPKQCEAYRAHWRALARGPCAHLGEEVRREQCQSCCGKVLLKIYACAVHGECTPQMPLAGVACCGGCTDYARGGGGGG